MYFVIILLSLALTSCMVGPNFHTPKAPPTERYTKHPLPKKTVATPSMGSAGKSQYFTTEQNIPQDWWTIFHSSPLNALIVSGLANSPNLTAARASLQQAAENYNAQVGNLLYPQITSNLSGTRTRINPVQFGTLSSPSVFDLYNASASVTYLLDIFGGSRRQLEALCAQVHYEWFQLQGAQLTLTSNIVTTAITIASIQEQIKATLDLIQAQASQLSLTEKQFFLGGVSKADVLSQQSQLAQTRATLPPLKQLLAQNLHALATLIGRTPSLSELPVFELNKFTLPTTLPVTLPSSFVRQRPDIRASEALLHAANAQIGVATANLYPQVRLSAGYGWEDSVLSNLFQNKSSVWNYGGALAQPIFNGGALRAQRRAAIAARDLAAAQYCQTVLLAFQNVADTLRALEHDAQELQAQRAAEVSAKESLDLTRNQYRLGSVNYINLLIAERTYQQARINRIRSQAARYVDTAALFQALGGGWWSRRENG